MLIINLTETFGGITTFYFLLEFKNEIFFSFLRTFNFTEVRTKLFAHRFINRHLFALISTHQGTNSSFLETMISTYTDDLIRGLFEDVSLGSAS